MPDPVPPSADVPGPAPLRDARPGPPVSLVCTVLDVEDELEPMLAGLVAQRRAPDELVVVDGGSTDGTVARLEAFGAEVAYPVRVLEAPGANISAGRNIAIRAAAHEWIAVTDAGCRADPGWLDALMRHAPGADLVAGLYRVEGPTDLEAALSAALYPDVEEAQRPDALARLWQRVFGRAFAAHDATGRSAAFTRAAWTGAGGYPETVAAGEDTAFARTIVAGGGRAVLATDAIVDWRTRPTWAANARMYAGYARGDVAMGRVARHLGRLAIWTAMLMAAVAGRRPGRVLAAGWAGAYCWLPLRRARRRRLGFGALWRIPVAIVGKDLAMGYGALSGLRALRRRGG